MSLLRRRTLTPAELAARRANARKSTGPRTLLGKVQVRLNALKDGRYAKPFRRFLLDLGEDPREFDRRLCGLIAAFQPSDARALGEVERLAALYWDKRRLERLLAFRRRRSYKRLLYEPEMTVDFAYDLSFVPRGVTTARLLGRLNRLMTEIDRQIRICMLRRSQAWRKPPEVRKAPSRMPVQARLAEPTANAETHRM